MLKNISLGVYYPGNSLLHRLQARTKLLVLFLLIACLTAANQHQWHFAPYIVAVILLCAGVALSGISPHHIWQRMRLLVLLAILGAILTLLFPDAVGKPLYTIGPILVSYALLHWAIIVYGVLLTVYIFLLLLPLPGLRTFRQQRWLRRTRIPLILVTMVVLAFLWFHTFIRDIPLSKTLPLGPMVITYDTVWLLMTVFTVFLVLYALSLLLTMTTTPVGLIEGMSILLTPLRWLRLPVDDFALMTLIALRFIPTLLDEADQLIKAQTARGADLVHGTIRERLQSLATLFVPLILGSLRRAADLATALEARGYEVDGRQTLLHEKSLGAVDYLVLVVVVVGMVAALVL